MTIRQLSQENANALVERGHEAFRTAHEAWKRQQETPPQKIIFERAFSDGIKAALEVLTNEGFLK